MAHYISSYYYSGEIQMKQYDPMWVDVSEEKFMLFLHNTYVVHHRTRTKKTLTLKEFEEFFEQTIHQDDWMEEIPSGLQSKPMFSIREEGVVLYTTSSNRTFAFNPERREVYSRGMKDSENFLLVAEKFLGDHTKEWNSEFFKS